MKMKYAIALIAASLVSLSGASAFADGPVAEIGVSTTYYADSSFDALSEGNAQSALGLTGGWQFDRLGGLRLLATAEFTGRDSTRFGGDFDASWGKQNILALAEYGLEIWPWFRPYVRAGAGYVHQFLAVQSVDPRLKDHAHDLSARGALGLDFSIPFVGGALGLGGQFGYDYQTPANFDELRHDRDAFEAKYSPDEDPWTREQADLGSLNLHGLFWTVGMNIRFDL